MTRLLLTLCLLALLCGCVDDISPSPDPPPAMYLETDLNTLHGLCWRVKLDWFADYAQIMAYYMSPDHAIGSKCALIEAPTLGRAVREALAEVKKGGAK